MKKPFDTTSKPAVAKGAGRYVVGDVQPFDQKNEMFKRPLWDESVADLGRKYYGLWEPQDDRPGYGFLDQAFKNATYYIDFAFAHGMFGGRWGLYAWESKPWGENIQPKGLNLDVDDSHQLTRAIKKAATFFGASLVGICSLDRRWLYSHHYYPKLAGFSETVEEVDIPEDYKYAIVLAYEGDYETLKYSPAYPAGAAVGMGYTKMAVTAATMAQFIRLLGYKAIPAANDTACSVPMAIDAGMGELSRAGWLITPQCGPRVRLNKIFTDLPLIPDEPIEFGVWDFCHTCGKCALHCPGQAIPFGDPTTDIQDCSNREGLYRWPLNAVKCFHFWSVNGTACANCIRVCPFNKPEGILHSAVKWGIRNTHMFNRLFLRGDDLMGYGKQKKAGLFWV
ncbi:MAG: reductive dehalogenase [Deltaproteobacteria bacterium]|nr:reductive dehalogenase [Deltaproteobacteria bacterium]